MVKKSNKTEQVMKLITKENEGQENDGDTGAEIESRAEPEVEISVKPLQKQEHKVETKIKIEIEPEVEVKQKTAPEEDIVIKVPAPAKEEAKEEASVINKTSAEIYEELCTKENLCLVNLTEHIVKEKAFEIMRRLNVCNCPICSLDVLALTLNTLPNKYITTDYGRLHLQLEIYKKQYETDVVSALTKACVRVKVSPRHEV
ncbi:hypothetical protein MASR2M70_19210 [Bacillota bacterium]